MRVWPGEWKCCQTQDRAHSQVGGEDEPNGQRYARHGERVCESYTHSLAVIHRQRVILIVYRTSVVHCRAKQSLTERQAMDESIRKLNQMVIDKDNKKSVLVLELETMREHSLLVLLQCWWIIRANNVGRSAVETDLKIEREWRASLQKNFEQEKEKVAKLEGEMQAFRELKQVRYIPPPCSRYSQDTYLVI